MRIFGREPALWLALGASVISVIGAFWVDLGVDQQGALNAVLFTIVGIVTAITVRDGVGAAVLGLFKALLSLALAFGLHITPEQQAVIMSLVAAATAMFVRTQVEAPVPPPPAPPAT